MLARRLGRWVRRRPPPLDNSHGTRLTRMIVATCHRDQHLINNDTASLAEFCQRCHLRTMLRSISGAGG